MRIRAGTAHIDAPFNDNLMFVTHVPNIQRPQIGEKVNVAMEEIIVAVSLKMYFSQSETRSYAKSVLQISQSNPYIENGRIQMALFPDHLAIPGCAGILGGSGVLLGAQDASWCDRGAFTGEVSPSDLKEIGCGIVELGHAERRTIFSETSEMVTKKTAATIRNRMVPLICVGERDRNGAEFATNISLNQAMEALGDLWGQPDEVWIAYEPLWAIGANRAAPVGHVVPVLRKLREGLAGAAHTVKILYGGSAGPGTLSAIYPAADGIFLGRFAHEIDSLKSVVDEAAELINEDEF